jgi:hypothetical protein
VVVKLASHPHGLGVQVDIFQTKRSEFRPTEAGEGGQQDQRPVSQPDRISEGVVSEWVNKKTEAGSLLICPLL